MTNIDDRFRAAVASVPTSTHVANLHSFARMCEDVGGTVEACALREAADRMEHLEAEAQWLAMQLGKRSVPGTMTMAKKRETRAQYWREAAKKERK